MIRGKKDIRFMLGLYDKGHNDVLCECMCKTVIAASEKPAQDTSLQMTEDEGNGDFVHEM